MSEKPVTDKIVNLLQDETTEIDYNLKKVADSIEFYEAELVKLKNRLCSLAYQEKDCNELWEKLFPRNSREKIESQLGPINYGTIDYP